jgi:hypothetical protein
VRFIHPYKGDTLKKASAKTTTGVRKTASLKTSVSRLKAGPPARVIKRTAKSAVSAAKIKANKAVKEVVQRSRKATVVSANATRTAEQVGRAVGTALGKAIGNVERAVTRVMKSARLAKKE